MPPVSLVILCAAARQVAGALNTLASESGSVRSRRSSRFLHPAATEIAFLAQRQSVRSAGAPAAVRELFGHSEKCFSAYVEFADRQHFSTLAEECPMWLEWVSTDGETPDKIHSLGEVAVLGYDHVNASVSPWRLGSIQDVGVDLGGGFNQATVNGSEASGVHLLSIPRHYVSDCCSTSPHSLRTALQDGRGHEVCSLLKDSIRGGVKYAGEYRGMSQATNSDDVHGFSQCFHRTPDVNYLHLHTTAGVAAKREHAEPSPGVGRSAASLQNLWLGPKSYNVCACEPAVLRDTSGRGHCPEAPPNAAEYVLQAAHSLCLNLAGVAQLSEDFARTACADCSV